MPYFFRSRGQPGACGRTLLTTVWCVKRWSSAYSRHSVGGLDPLDIVADSAHARDDPRCCSRLTGAAVEALAEALPSPGLPDLYPLQHRVHAGLLEHLELDGCVLRLDRSQFLYSNQGKANNKTLQIDEICVYTSREYMLSA